MDLKEIELIKENEIKIKARHYYCKYGYAIAELVLNDIIRVIDKEKHHTLKIYKSILKTIKEKNLI